MNIDEAALMMRKTIEIIEKAGYELDWIDGDEGPASLSVRAIGLPGETLGSPFWMTTKVPRTLAHLNEYQKTYFTHSAMLPRFFTRLKTQTKYLETIDNRFQKI